MNATLFSDNPAARRALAEFMPLPADILGNPRYGFVGIEWLGRTYDSHDTLSGFPREDVIITVRKFRDTDEASWDWAFKIADGVFARHEGHAPDLATACTAAVVYAPAIHVFPYLGTETTWYETATGTLYAQIDGDAARVSTLHNGEWRYERAWPPAAPIVAAMGQRFGSLSGFTRSRDEAIIAAIDAPETLKRACAQLVATFTPERPETQSSDAGMRYARPSDPRDLPPIAQAAVQALQDQDANQAEEFTKWLVTDVCGQRWVDGPDDYRSKERSAR